MSRNTPGPSVQSPLTINGNEFSSSICYEIAYPDLVRSADTDPAFILTVSNDTWFGSSIGPWQHLQLARMRALENERLLVRTTNNGITAAISSPRTSPCFIASVYEGGSTLRFRNEVRQDPVSALWKLAYFIYRRCYFSFWCLSYAKIKTASGM